jgi:hypothetical protein
LTSCCTVSFCRFNILIFCILFVFPPLVSFAQDDLPTLGAEIRPLIPSDLFAIKAPNPTFGHKVFTINPQGSYSAGGVIRLNLTKFWNLESGIYYTSRVYGSNMKDSGGINASGKIIFDNYEVPVLGLIYIRLAKNIYLNNAFGLSLDFFPTDAQSPDNGYYYQKLARTYWILPALMANIGAEYRTEKNGYFYLGALYHRMLIPMGQTEFFFNDSGFPAYTPAQQIQGHYFAVDLKYFFPTKRTPEINNGVGYLGY